MKIPYTCASILMVSSMLLFADTSQAAGESAGESMSAHTGGIGTMRNSMATGHGVPSPSIGEKMNRGMPSRSLGEIQLGMPNVGRSAAGSYDAFGQMATSGSMESFDRITIPGGGTTTNIGSPGADAIGGPIGGP